MNILSRCSAIIAIMTTGSFLCAQSSDDSTVKLIRSEHDKKIDVFVGGKLFTSYRYSPDFEKTFLFPVCSPDGAILTRGYPIEPRKGERVDHPHHTGVWFNHGNVNGIDFWNNSRAIPADKRNEYGHIVQNEIVKISDGKKGYLEVSLYWTDSHGNKLLREDTEFIFSGDKHTRTIDRVTKLTAVNVNVVFSDSKEGLFAIRVDRALEMPSKEPLVFTDDKGNATTVPSVDSTGVTGRYKGSNGLNGNAVWGTRNKWVILTGVKNEVPVAIGLFDNPKNPGYPAYAHARGYGLFSINNFGQNSYDPGKEKRNYTIVKGKSVTLYHRLYIQSGSELTSEKAEEVFDDFVKQY